jgi:multicomponent Na+:H+ antiporter subunit D
MINLWMTSLLSLLVAALIVPFFKTHHNRAMMLFSLVVLTFALISQVLIMRYVLLNGSFYYAFGGHQGPLGISFLVDEFSVLIATFIISLTWLIFIYGWANIKADFEKSETSRYVNLVFIMIFSMVSMVYTNDLFNTYVFMEIMSITTVAIISVKQKKENYSAAFRYLMLNEVGSLSFLFGIGMLYMIGGHLNMDAVALVIAQGWPAYGWNIGLALGLMILGLAIKSAIYPMHVWLPDAHGSAPSTSSAILSSIVVKVYLVVLIKVIYRIFGFSIVSTLGLHTLLMVLAILGMLIGSLFAMAQTDSKRLLGYSSVSQIGYIVLGISLGTPLGLYAAIFHIISHGILKTSLFLSVGSFISEKKIRKTHEFRGLGVKMPLATGVFTISSLGMIGIPITSGFIAKWQLGLALSEISWWLIGVVLISSLMNAIYYLPIVIDFYLKPNPEHQVHWTWDGMPKRMAFVLIVLALSGLTFGLFPGLIETFIEQAVAAL